MGEPTEPTLAAALSRVWKERTAFIAALTVLGGGGGWQLLESTERTDAAQYSATFVATQYQGIVTLHEATIAKLEAQIVTQRELALALLEKERENTKAWRDQCAGRSDHE